MKNQKLKFKQTEIGPIPEGWDAVDLEEMVSFSNGKSSPERFSMGNYPVYGANGVIGFSDEENTSGAAIVVGRVGAYCGSIHFSRGASWITDNAIKGVAKEGADIRFLYYLLGTLALNERAGGSGQPLVNQSILNSIKVQKPPLPEQSRIASILSSLDDKIELNRKINANLERIASALFKRWFVDFEFPVEPLNPAPQPPKGGAGAVSRLSEGGVGVASGKLFSKGGVGEKAPAVLNSADRQLYAELEAKAKEMRARPTPAEAVLWERLRNNALGVKFRRQHVIDRFIVDFYCIEKGLVIEVDGGIHETQKESDEEREAVLRNHGCRILRFTNEQVLNDIESVLSKITSTVISDSYASPKSPLGDLGALPGYKSSGGRMVESELGEIPEGWRVDSLDRIANFLNGLALQKYPAESEEKYLPVIKIRELNNGITVDSDKASIDIPKEYIVKNGDVIFSWSGSLDITIWYNGFGALNQHLFKVTSDRYPKWFYYRWIRYFLPSFQSIAADKAVTMGHIKRGHLTEAKVTIPDDRTLSKMDEYMAPLVELFARNSIEIQALIGLRDSLLPRLMSGRIRVKV